MQQIILQFQTELRGSEIGKKCKGSCGAGHEQVLDQVGWRRLTSLPPLQARHGTRLDKK